MAYLTESHLDNRHCIPVVLPLTLLRQADWLILSTLKLSATMDFNYRFLQLQLIDITVEGQSTGGDCDCAVPDPELINPDRGLAYVAIYQNYSINTDPSSLTFVGSEFDLVAVFDVGIAERDITEPALEISGEAANYSFVLVNNTSNADLRLAVNGQVTITI